MTTERKQLKKLRKNDQRWPQRDAGWFSKAEITVHYEDEDGEEDQKCDTLREALGTARGWFGTNETIPTNEEMENVWIDVKAVDERTGTSVRFYIGHDAKEDFYFQVSIPEATFRRYVEANLGEERDYAQKRLEALQRFLSRASTGDIDEMLAIYDERRGSR